MRIWCATLLKVLWGVYFLLTSIYCLLAYLPYTYCALIKAPPYAWIPWFSNHYAILYWLFVLVLVVECFLRSNIRSHSILLVTFGVAGVFITVRPFLPNLQDDEVSYLWSLGCLLPLVAVGATDLVGVVPQLREDKGRSSLLTYSGGVMAGAVASLLYSGAAEYRKFIVNEGMRFHPFYELSLVSWSLVSHVMIAVTVLSVLNLIWLVAFRTARPTRLRGFLLGMIIFVGLWVALLRFLQQTFSFDGWPAEVYSAALSASLVLWGFSITAFFMVQPRVRLQELRTRKALFLWMCAGMSVCALAFPRLIGGGDWNGILQSTFTLTLWLVLGFSAYALPKKSRQYSVAAVLGVLIFSISAYKGLQASEIIWAKSLGSTDDEIARTMELYATSDASFQLAHHLLGNSAVRPCGDLCRIMREYTNIRNAQAKVDVNLVDELVPTGGERPNIFIFVIDSMRPDYLGAYNQRVDFTPNLDSLARDGIAMRNVYTQYAGTSLSEPAIWSGAQLLHAHFLQPFTRVNSLQKLAETDEYQTVVSYDTVLKQLFPASASITKLDTDKPMWNNFEVCSTVQQTENLLQNRVDKARPVLFYAQPMNVHQFAKNSLPLNGADSWKSPAGFNNRIAHEVHQVDACLGDFLSFLKAQNSYDNSIIVVTSDHGDATGEFGRSSHSMWIYPEIMRVPLIIHLPRNMRKKVVYDDSRISALTDITPTLYYLLGHRPIVHNPLFGQPLFAETKEELARYQRDTLFLASDVRADYGVLAANGRWLYVTYDSPPQSMLFDLVADPNAQHNLLTSRAKKNYDEQIIEHLQAVAAFYEYKPRVGSWLAASK